MKPGAPPGYLEVGVDGSARYLGDIPGSLYRATNMLTQDQCTYTKRPAPHQLQLGFTYPSRTNRSLPYLTTLLARVRTPQHAAPRATQLPALMTLRRFLIRAVRDRLAEETTRAPPQQFSSLRPA